MSVQFPKKPKLRGYYRIIHLADRRLLFEGGGNSVVMRGVSVEELLPLLLPYLDGTHTVDGIVASLPNVEPSVVVQALELLASKRLLEDPALPPPLLGSSAARYQHQTTFWLSVDNDRYRHQEKLATARVAVFGLGGIGSEVATILAMCGVGQLVVVDAKPVSAGDQLFAGSYSAPNIGRNRAVVLTEQLAMLNDNVHYEGLDTTLTSTEEAASVLEGCTMAVVCSDSPTITINEAINEACLRLDIPWSRGSLDHHRGVIGPTVLPHQTACFTCFNLRLRSNVAYVDDAIVLEQHLREDQNDQAELGLLRPFVGAVAHHISLEVIKTLTYFAYPATAGGFLALDFLTTELTRHEVLKLPRCPSCGPVRERPQMKIWDVVS